MHVNNRPIHAVVVLATLAVLAIAVSVSLLLLEMRSRELTRSRQEAVSLAEIYSEQAQQQVEAIDLAMTGVQERLQTAFGESLGLDSLPIHLLLRTRILGVPQLRVMFLVNEHGRIVNVSNESQSTDISVIDRNYFKVFSEAVHEGLYIDKPVRSRINGNWSMFLSKRVTDAKGRFKGVVVAGLNLEKYEQGFRSNPLDSVHSVSLYFEDGTLIASNPHKENQVGNTSPEFSGEKLPSPTDKVRLIQHRSGDGSVHVFALGHLSHYPLLVGVSNDEELSLASWRETAVPIAMGAGLIGFFIIVVAFLLVGEMQREETLSHALKQVTNRYEHTVDSVMDAIVAIDDQQKIVLFNPAAERMFKRVAADALGQSLGLLMPERFKILHKHHVMDFTSSSGVSRTMAPQLDIVGMRADGVEFPIESTISITHLGGEVQMTAVLRDVSEHRRAEAELRQMNTQLRELSASLQDVREQERSRIARELHDELGQQLTGLKLDFSWLRSRLKDGRTAEPEKVEEMKHSLDQAIASVRRISTELRPPILDDLGFGEAVVWQAQEIAKRSSLVLDMDLAAADKVHDASLATALFRITQESMTNIVRHAQARHVFISLKTVDEQLVLSVRDDGVGYMVPRKGGVGLASMQERARAMGGVFQVGRHGDGPGTEITVSLPLSLAVFEKELS
jgi:PAS domain S-box-containing protein